MYNSVIIVFLTIVAVAWGDESDSCVGKLECIEENLIKAVDKLDSQKTIAFLDEIVVIDRIKEVDVGRKKEDLFDRLTRYLSSHEIKLRMPEADSRAIEARKRKWRKYILPLLLVLKLKAAILIPSALIVLGFTAVKALASGFLVLGFTIGSALKGMYTEYHHTAPHKVSYEVVPHLWNRAGIENFPLDHGYHTIS